MGLSVRLSRLIYVSADSSHIASVNALAEKNRNDIKNPFDYSSYLIDSPFQVFLASQDLIKSGQSRLSAIIDYRSFIKLKSLKTDFVTVIRDVVLCFPEINYYFDESNYSDDSKEVKGFLHFIVNGSGLSVSDSLQQKVTVKLHSFDSGVPDAPFDPILQGKDNLFDASNLRYFMKMMKYQGLSLRQNYRTIQESRCSNFALCVEEERSQSLFNSVALYLNGYRVLPITSAGELQWANENVSPDLIIRDYDLQFSDAAKSYQKNLIRKKGQKSTESSKSDVIHMIRGWRFDKTWACKLDENNLYWSRLLSVQTYYVSKGAQDQLGNRNLFLSIPKTEDEESQQFVKGIGETRLELPGIYKPVSGIYTPFHQINCVARRFNECYKEEEGGLPVITNRTEEGGHGVPLDIYGVVKSMVDRAEAYYKNNRFVHAVIVANDAIEIMNGFHQALTIKAYRCLAMSENAIAANILGGDEICLEQDTTFRLSKIEKEVTRISSIGDKADTLNVNKRRNMLNQIYNEIRVYCKEKEHFYAENAVIRAMGHLNEGFSISEFIHFIKGWFKKD